MTPDTPDAPWIVFDDVAVFTGGPRAIEPSAATAGRAILFVPETARLVVQRGHAFRAENPGVSILLERGRLALVALDPAVVDAVPSSTSYSLVDPGDLPKLPGGTDILVGDALTHSEAVSAEVAAIHADDLERLVRALSVFDTRHWQSPYFDRAVNLVGGWLKGFGYETEKTAVITGSLPHTYNLSARRPGRAPGAPRVVVCAHLDSMVYGKSADLTAPAPGAADNASGCASVIAIAHALQGVALGTPEIEVEFIFFGAEEDGLEGSIAYLKSLKECDRAGIVAAVNLDMPAVKKGTILPRVLLDPEPKSSPTWVTDQLADCAATYVPDLEVHRLKGGRLTSDHVTFGEAGIPSTLVIEDYSQDNHYMHTVNDEADNLNFEFHEKVTRMCCAWVAHMVRGDFEIGPMNETP